MKQTLVTVTIPTFNCEKLIVDCLESVKKQTYDNIEIIIVDSFSTDRTPEVARKYGTVYSYGRNPQQKNIFAVPYQRNFGVSKAKGTYVYWIDSDMRLTPTVIDDCVKIIEKTGADAVIVPERTVGEGFWAQCRRLEKDCYNASPHSYADAARFLKKSVWDAMDGLDPTLGGGDDWDFQLRLNDAGFKTVKTTTHIFHYEGKVTLSRQIKKKYVYGKDMLKYFRKHGDRKGLLFKQYSLIRVDWIKHYDKLLADPSHAIGMVVLKTLEYLAAVVGMVKALLNREKVIIGGNDL